jgi:thiol-disulfide isomerase/thioredoxin
MRALRILVVAGVAIGAAAAGVWTANYFLAPTVVTAPPEKVSPRDVALTDLDGYSRRLSDWHGKIVLVNFWATWCPPCLEEIPLLQRAQATWGKHGLQIVGIAIEEEEAVSAFQRTAKLSYPVLIGETDGIGAPDGLALMAEYGNPGGGLPFSVVLDRNGNVLGTKRGAYKAAELQSLLSRLLRPQQKGD